MMIELIPASLVHAPLLSGMHGICFADRWSTEAMVELLEMPGAEGLLAVDGNSLTPSTVPPGPAGMVLWRVAGDEAEILTIAVLPPWRRSGLGQRLLEAAARASRAKGAVVMFLEVADDNLGAQALYLANGFAKVGLRKGYYADKDAIVMRRDF
ncbi:GNAT family N-acetyltransferase [Magnetospirillum gryphiswaldense]|uniref:Ribosomal protein S18 alanine N-acetyltransferase n=2 Tax=Magnetospirillum gryphiswaldense TaxID=55518 RepID=V6F489_MAGGM|nr:GNAT family N-acetyltransferase [Magnetospirillum gryphiswaldense]AVM75315.1 ribosomal-protein-alanine N-acetyltransferase [Magnetospirillum gryphiswaldense MSR-1]AVM79218.1 ribosomal-protein-alanine N-acetyltransferase [Magnetospirillum gryphiswaldense]CDL00330.1 ribosomal protein S18 alanine N-acetyltransferase [Magnetospirillum gryphiswaldense MSR-1 v2]